MDTRSKRIVYVSHCLLNSNTAAQGLGFVKEYPSLVPSLIKTLCDLNVGIVQLPCPEKVVLGLVREPRDKDKFPQVEIKKEVKKVAVAVCEEIENYIKNGFEVLAIIGKRGSAVCAVKECWVRGALVKEHGFLIQALQDELKRRKVSIPFVDFERDEEAQCVDEIKQLLAS